jgi:trehalose 6-phosphate synthase/phosphatase
VEREARAPRRKYGRKKVILTVDRLDPTKGLVQRLQAYKAFLEQNPQFLGKVVMVMLATPSRTEIAEYKKLKKQVESLVTDINETFGYAGWLPVDYKYETLPYERVVALYKIADVAFITPLRDGMNLVAKEYVASKQSKNGVLILSETAGAAEELTNAILVNPRRRPAMVAALNKALTMPNLELKKRLSAMQSQLSKNTVQKWAGTFMGTLQRPAQSVLYPTRGFTGALRRLLLDNYHHAQKRQIFMDYDGTVLPFFGDPARSKPTSSLFQLLEKLSAYPGNELVIISGRSRENLEEWLGTLPITLVAEHGSFIKKPGGRWTRKHHTTLGWKKSIREMMEIYAKRTPGAFVEEKESSLVWHFRKSPPYQAQKNMVILKQLLNKTLRGTDLRVYSGNKILEVKPKSVSKGAAVSELIANGTDFILSIGDDYTDEDMFASLPAYAFTVKVGPGRTHARYRIKSVDEVLSLLKKLV